MSSNSSQFYFKSLVLSLKRLVSLKAVLGFPLFDYASFSLKFIFLFNRKHKLFDFKMS